MGKLVIQKPAAFEVTRLRKDLADCGWVFGQPKLMGLHLRWDGKRLLLANGGEVTGLPHITRALAERLPGVDLEGGVVRFDIGEELHAAAVAGVENHDRDQAAEGGQHRSVHPPRLRDFYAPFYGVVVRNAVGIPGQVDYQRSTSCELERGRRGVCCMVDGYGMLLGRL